MNYRHAYHAGSFADVVKHAVLALAVERLKAKDAAFCVLDTHAGTGCYDLATTTARKTGEYETGIGRLLARDPRELPAELKPYLGAVAALNGGAQGNGGLRWYPGSPRLVRALMREQDRLMALELHPEDAVTLAALFQRDPQVQVRQGDGYVGLKALLPPRERRGLVLIDPPFEAADEFEQVVRGLRQAYRRWATGHYVIWYPIKQRAPVAAFHEALKATGIARILAAELLLRPAEDPRRLNGSGLILVNPPWPIEDQLRSLLPALAEILGAEAGGGARVEWLVPESKRPAA
ncbi:23S rRNA (adenine(2030)-N(6))-methyltransferase RlmJ [Pelagibius sp. 7325]|uniref:23S rRNA (adenine(2030)-N(6))-methyltransferase RlmJ n=1 Tax=Pelagibius sp. 7325 TaxID=3131994 RepID=UPI0030EF805B